MKTLKETAAAIRAHLMRFESDPKINTRHYGISTFWCPNTCQAGAYVQVKYISFKTSSNLGRAEAERYLAWLDAGNVGTHWEIPEDFQPIASTVPDLGYHYAVRMDGDNQPFLCQTPILKKSAKQIVVQPAHASKFATKMSPEEVVQTPEEAIKRWRIGLQQEILHYETLLEGLRVQLAIPDSDIPEKP